MADFEKAYEIMKGNEGGYSNDPDDKGGETYAGITRKNFPDWDGWWIVDSYKPLKRGDIIKNPVIEQYVKKFYEQNFWHPINGNLIESQELANQVFDFAVNAGVQNALKLLSKS